jgi:hypothetical protein
VVLSRIGLLLIALAGCGQSLFDSRGDIDGGPGGGDGGDGGGTDGPVASSCPAGCIGDAAADFDGSPAGSTGRWRYLDDRRTRAWTAMTASGNVFTGADPNNKITTCAEEPTAAACGQLPGALVVSSAGATSGADPALEYTVAANNVIQLTLRVHVPTGTPAQIVRIYRNSREDVLTTATAMPGVTLDRAVTLDALAGDRFLVALAPDAMGAANVAVQLFVNTTGAVFPSKCQLALNFSVATGTSVDNLCGADLNYNDDTLAPAAEEVPPVLGAGPFTEHGQAADIAPDHYYLGTGLLDRTGDSTIQMWVKHDALVSSYGAWIFSDEDLNSSGGLGAVIYDPGPGGLNLDVVSCVDASLNPCPVAIDTVPYPTDRAWHFLRVTHSGGMVKICLDGRKLGEFAVPATKLISTFPPHIGRNVRWSPQGAFFDGSLDDVRAFTTALACE